MTSRLTFSPRAHTYALDGKRVPGVTTVLGNATNIAGLPWSAARETALWALANRDGVDVVGSDVWLKNATMAHRAVWDRSRDAGTTLHEAARQLVAGEPLAPAFPDGAPWPDDVRLMAEQLARFMDRWQMDPVHTEAPVYHASHLWAGTVDAVANMRDGRLWLLDYKTGKTGVYPKDALQVCAYRHAECIVARDGDEYVDKPFPAVEESALVWVRPDHWELRRVRTDDVAYDVFRHMLPVAAWSKWPAAASVGEPLPIPALDGAS